MLKRKILIYLLPFVLLSCAQIGTISGGARDENAPKPDFEKSSPPIGTTFFTGKQIIIPFDEFFTLQDPTKNIRIVPPHATIRSKIKGKDLILEWTEDLQANTTYSIYLDNAVRDITENNDSLIQFVFSTGDHIDSLHYTGRVIDAWNKEAVRDVSAFVYAKSDSSLISYAKTDRYGNFQLNYLPAGDYFLSIIGEKIPDNKWSKDELFGFKEDGTVSLTSSITDSIPFLVSRPNADKQLRTATYSASGLLKVGAYTVLSTEALRIDDTPIASDRIRSVAPDSLHIYLPTRLLSSGSHLLQANNDSIRFRVPMDGIKFGQITSAHERNNVNPSNGIRLIYTDFIRSIDTNHIHLFNSKDSSEIAALSIHHEYNELTIEIQDRNAPGILVMIDSAAITGETLTNSYFEGVFNLVKARELGGIKLDLSELGGGDFLIDVLKDNKFAFRRYAKETILQLNELLPGSYTFRVIRDTNSNGLWDPVDPVNLTQAEEVLYFESENKLRANWEIEVKLMPGESW